MLNGEITDNFTKLYTSYLRFTSGTNSMHASLRAYGILVFFYRFRLFQFQVKDAAGTMDQTQIASAGPGQVEVYTCKSNLTLNCIIWVC